MVDQSNPTIDIQSIKEQVFGATPIAKQDEPASTSLEPTANDPINNGGDESNPVIDSNIDPAANTADEGVQKGAPVFNINDYLKELGYENEDVFKKEISELKKLKDSPPVQTTTEPEFANEESKKIYQNLKAGNVKEVGAYLKAKELLSDVDALSDEQRLKLFIKLQNPKFDQDLIDDEYKEKYTFNEEDFTGDDLKLRKEKVKLAQRLEDDLLKAQEYFKQYQAKLELPNIEAAAAQPAVDEEYKKYQEHSSKAQEEYEKLVQELSKLSEKDVNLKFKFTDEASKMDFDINYEFDKNGFEDAKAAAAKYVDYLAKSYYKEDGSPLHDKLVADIYYAQNKEKIHSEIVKQAVNATKRWFLANQKNIDNNGQRNYGQNAPDEIQKLKEQLFGSSTKI